MNRIARRPPWPLALPALLKLALELSHYVFLVGSLFVQIGMVQSKNKIDGNNSHSWIIPDDEITEGDENKLPPEVK